MDVVKLIFTKFTGFSIFVSMKWKSGPHSASTFRALIKWSFQALREASLSAKNWEQIKQQQSTTVKDRPSNPLCSASALSCKQTMTPASASFTAMLRPVLRLAPVTSATSFVGADIFRGQNCAKNMFLGKNENVFGSKGSIFRLLGIETNLKWSFLSILAHCYLTI